MTLDQAVALSLLGDQLPKPGLTARLRAGRPGTARARSAALETRARLRRRAARLPASTCCRGTIRAFPAAARAPSPTVRRCCGIAAGSSCLRRTGRGDRRIARRHRRSRSRPPRAWPTDLAARGIHRRQRAGARRRFGGPSRRAAATGRTIAVLGSGVDHIYPPEHAPLAGADRSGRRRPQRVSARHGAAAAPLSAAQSSHQRTLAGGRRDRGVGEVGVAHHRACALEQGREVMAVPGNVLERPEPRRPRPAPGRRKDCRDCGRYRRGTGRRSGSRIGRSMAVTSSSATASFSGSGAAGDGGGARLRPRCAGGRSGLRCHVALLPRLIELELAGLVRRQGGGRFIRPS